MAVLSDSIEHFLLSLLNDEETPTIVVQRNELAEHFGCAPSQINYVLSTRFSVDRGYTIESRRGGGGFIRIRRVNLDRDAYLYYLLTERVTDLLSEGEIRQLLHAMITRGIISASEGKIIISMLTDKALVVPEAIRDRIRASIFSSLLAGLMDR